MSRARTNKLYRTFTKGLITEAGYLTYPEDASTDELNTIISRKGNRTRRPGIDYEDDFVLTDVGLSDELAINEFVWLSAENNSQFNFLVLQVGKKLYFFKMDSVPVSDNGYIQIIDLTNHTPPTSSTLDVETNYAQFDAGAGFLFVAHPYVEPLMVAYDTESDAFIAIKVVVQVRDLEGIYDGLANDQEPSTLTKEHHYNLLNQGWMAPGTIPTPALAFGELPVSGSGSGVAPGGGGVYIDPYTGTDREYERESGGYHYLRDFDGPIP